MFFSILENSWTREKMVEFVFYFFSKSGTHEQNNPKNLFKKALTKTVVLANIKETK
jgi:hypothetical protein